MQQIESKFLRAALRRPGILSLLQVGGRAQARHDRAGHAGERGRRHGPDAHRRRVRECRGGSSSATAAMPGSNLNVVVEVNREVGERACSRESLDDHSQQSSCRIPDLPGCPPSCMCIKTKHRPADASRRCCVQKEKTQLAMLHVRGAAVRFVHVPGRLDPNAAIVAHRRRVAEAAKSARRQHDAGHQRFLHVGTMAHFAVNIVIPHGLRSSSWTGSKLNARPARCGPDSWRHKQGVLCGSCPSCCCIASRLVHLARNVGGVMSHRAAQLRQQPAFQ